jgi:hypothetical protein
MPPQIHLIDQTWIDASAQTVSRVVADSANWTRWWPDLSLTVTRDRGIKGMQWSATGALSGTVEIWLEPVKSGVILHHFLRLEPTSGKQLSRSRTVRKTKRLAWHAKRAFWELKDQLESPGTSTSSQTAR